MPQEPATIPQSALYILVAIGPHERHGYAIMTEVERMTGGAVRMAPGTLYTSIRRLVDGGLLEEIDERPGAHGDARRRYYRLTSSGRAAVATEIERTDAILSRARSWLPGRPA